jgi:hypothetical protein
MSANTDFRLPDLRFVPVDAVFPHEYNDLQRTEPLVRKLRESGVMRNPPIVTQVGDGHRVEPRYVVLDGANRSTAAKAAGWPHVVAQVVRYESPTVHLHTWFHALTSDARAQIEAGLAGVPGLQCRIEERIHARAMLARREVLRDALRAQALVLVAPRYTTAKLLVEIVRVPGPVPYIRVSRLARAGASNIEISALIVFPRRPAEVIELASRGYLPAGITHHLISGARCG